MTGAPLSCDLAVVGGGAAGLSVAAGSARLGRSVVLFERGEMGGECLNTGCVPSKALLAAAARRPAPGLADAMEEVRRAIRTIAPHDSQERFEGLGVRVVREHARFADPKTLESASLRVRARRVVIAAGSRPAIPRLQGIATVPYLTNESVFDLSALPAHLLILGGGAVGVELAQGFRRLGAEVTVVEAGRPLAGFEPAHADLVLERLRAEGVHILAGARAEAVAQEGAGVVLTLDDGRQIAASHFLVAAGRAPATEGLDLQAGGVATDARGFIRTDDRLRTSNPRVYAAGDAAGREMLTHAAGAQAALLIRNFYFFGRARWPAAPVPAALYTDPELAQVGLTAEEARRRHGKSVRVTRAPFAGNDRAIAEGETEGEVTLAAGRGGKILGVSIAGREAGELIQIAQAAMAAGGGVKSLTGMIAPYPTRGEAVRRAASAWYEDLVFGKLARRIAALAARLH